MKSINYLIILIFATVLASCNDFLMQPPKSNIVVSNFYQSESDARQAINGIYSALRDPDVTGLTIKEVPNDLYKHNGTNDLDGMKDWTYSASNSVFLSEWRAHYGAIKNCNYAIYYINQNKAKITNYQKYIAQAKGVRAFLYFDLVRWFGDVPLVVTPTLDIQPNIGMVSRTRQDTVFNQIISDFKYCSSYSFPKDSTGYLYGMMSQEASHGFLSKVYLWIASVGERNVQHPELSPVFGPNLYANYKNYYDSALMESKKVIASQKYKLTAYYPDLFAISSKASAMEEVLFCAQAIRGGATGSQVGQQFGIQGSPLGGGSSGTILSTNYHRIIYEQGDSVRRLWNCARVQVLYNDTTKTSSLNGWDNGYLLNQMTHKPLSRANEYASTMNYCIGKFRRYPVYDPSTYTHESDGMDEPLLRYADILLIYAEAYNEVHQGPGSYTSSANGNYVGDTLMSAFTAVNLVRKRARTTNTGPVHGNIFPRVLNFASRDLVLACVTDWKPGFYGNIASNFLSANPMTVLYSPVYTYNGYTSDYQAFRSEILWERGREFVAEAADRWCDLVRRNLLVKQIQALQTTTNPFVFVNENLIVDQNNEAQNIDYHHMLLPIPQSEIDVNRNLKQNYKY
jgi:starch-binding outer membrane protein, SusD/RagB family